MRSGIDKSRLELVSSLPVADAVNQSLTKTFHVSPIANGDTKSETESQSVPKKISGEPPRMQNLTLTKKND